MRPIYLLILLQLLIVPTIGCVRTDPIVDKQLLYLDKWEISTGDGFWQSTQSVIWENDPPLGPIGEKWRHYDGYAFYRTQFTIPPDLAEQQLAFFISSIDDADVTYLNGFPIGKKGSFAESEISTKGFRSAVFEPRCYILPQNRIRINQPNELIIKVYDFSGSGGLNGDIKPVIGPYHLLEDKANGYFLLVNLPRGIILSLLITSIIFLGYRIAPYLSTRSIYYAAIRFIHYGNPVTFLMGKNRLDTDSYKGKTIYRYTTVIIIFILFSWVVLSGTHYKYILISSENFWFKSPALALYISFVLIIFTLHGDLFISHNIQRKWDILNKIAGVITHPGLLLFFVLYIAILPARESWSTSVVTGSLLMLVIFVIFFLFTAFQFIRAGSDPLMIPFGWKIRIEGIIRLILISGFTSSIVLFNRGTPFIQAQSILLVVTFTALYLLLTLYFYHRYNAIMPHKKPDNIPLAEHLRQFYHFTPKESIIAEKLASGMSREEICKKYEISPGTMKIHLKSIYSKTIDTDPYSRSTKSGKLQRLTIFLHSIDLNSSKKVSLDIIPDNK